MARRARVAPGGLVHHVFVGPRIGDANKPIGSVCPVRCAAQVGQRLQAVGRIRLTSSVCFEFLHKLDVPSTLHTSLLSTNIIENSFLNVRRKLGRVTRFRAETDQASRWLAYALGEAEKGFRRIKGWADLKHLKVALGRPSTPPPVAALPPAEPTRPKASG